MFDITIFMPGIRPNNWKAIYDSLSLACKKYKWQLLFVSPFNLPEDLLKYENVSLVIDRGSPTRAAQKGMLNVDSELFFFSVDDGIFLENSVDDNIDLWRTNCSKKDLICIRYMEADTHLPMDYWRMYHHPVLRLSGISPDQLFVHTMLANTENFYEIGGLDCQFEYLSYAFHDFSVRATRNGGKIFLSENECLDITWYPNDSGDHKPVYDAQTYFDHPLFTKMYFEPNDRVVIPYNNWKGSPHVWKRRFTNGIANSYENLCESEKYGI